MIVIDEYLAVRVVAGAWPERLPDDEGLAVIGELSADDLAVLLNVVDGLVAKSPLRWQLPCLASSARST